MGVSLGVIFAILAGVLLTRRYRLTVSLSKRGAAGDEQRGPTTDGAVVAEKYGHGYVGELPADGPRAELEAARRRGMVGEMP